MRPSATCPWRLQRGGTLYQCTTPAGTHTVHYSSPAGLMPISWRADDAGAFCVIGGSEPVDRMAIRLAPVDRCDNRQCPNQAYEGTMTITTIFTTPSGGRRDVTLLLCAPCAQYLSLVVRQ